MKQKVEASLASPAESFRAAVKVEFPDFCNRLPAEAVGDWNDPNLYLCANMFAEFINKSIQRGEMSVVERAYSVLERLLTTSDTSAELFNAVCVGVIEHLEFNSSPHGATAQRRMPPALRKEWLALEQYWKHLGAERQRSR